MPIGGPEAETYLNAVGNLQYARDFSFFPVIKPSHTQ